MAVTTFSVTLGDLGLYLAFSALPKPQECFTGLGQGGDNLQHAHYHTLIPTTTTTAQSSFPLALLFSEGSIAVCKPLSPLQASRVDVPHLPSKGQKGPSCTHTAPVPSGSRDLPHLCRQYPPTGEEAAVGEAGQGGSSVPGGSWRVLGSEKVGCELHNAFRGSGKRERVSCIEMCGWGWLPVSHRGAKMWETHIFGQILLFSF